jgi:hypothetical protein
MLTCISALDLRFRDCVRFPDHCCSGVRLLVSASLGTQGDALTSISISLAGLVVFKTTSGK